MNLPKANRNRRKRDTMFYADLHVHSRFSRATSPSLDLERLALWAARKGITIVGTGDFTHPEWFRELKQNLTPAEPGLFRLKKGIQRQVDEENPTRASATRFMLQVEISTIYKKDGKVRKVHHLIYAPSFAAARKINQKLGRIGNLASDGRPILGLDSRELLEIVLAADSDCYLIPAHIWTPWFSVFGSKSGFDAIEECYGDLSNEIFALETGLSADQSMIRTVSALDRFTLVSNSDAHSPAKLGREATIFHCDLDYYSIKQELQKQKNTVETVEFFPEEGKYHLDGHRKCGVRFTPEESLEHGNRCPVCDKPITLGVLNRVSELADRKKPPRSFNRSLERHRVPLDEVLSEVHQVGPKSKKVQSHLAEITTAIGSEFDVLDQAAPEDIETVGGQRLSQAIIAMRDGDATCEPGFDGEYGQVRLLSEEMVASR